VLTLPAAAAGGVAAAAAMGITTSLGLFAGLLALLGVAAIQVVLMIRGYQRLEREGGRTLGVALASRGASERLLPFLVSACATGAAMLPALLLGGEPGLEILQPMAVVVLGGLVSTAVLHLFLLPAMFLSLGVSSVRASDPLESEIGQPALAASGARAGISD
jgi:Cu/Ag efflux pump CusA